jgi:hypothetical protein
LLVAGCWLLVAGCWLLVAGCWLLVARKDRKTLVGFSDFKKNNTSAPLTIQDSGFRIQDYI